MNGMKENIKRMIGRAFLIAVTMAACLLGPNLGPQAGADVVTVAFDGFESKNLSGGEGWLGPWTKQGSLVLVKTNPYEGKRYAKLMGGAKPGRLERAVDLSAAAYAGLRFAGRVKSFEKNDKALVKVSSDGANYTVVAEFTPEHSDDLWHLYDIDLSAFDLSADFRVVFEAAMSKKKTDTWFLDNIEILGEQVATTFYLDTVASGQGEILIDPAGGAYAAGTQVLLTAEPATGWVFDHWEGDVGGSDNPVSLTMDMDKTVTAVFIQSVSYALEVSFMGNGDVALDPAGGVYTEGTVVTLTASADAGWRFTGWAGDLGGNANPVQITMDGDKYVEARFDAAGANKYKFVIYGDTRTNDNYHRSVLKSIVANTPDYKFIVGVGDVTDSSTAAQYKTWQKAWDDIMGGTGQDQTPPKFTTADGNHDSNGTLWKQYHSGQQQYGNNGLFFYFDYENVRVVVLRDETPTNTAQLAMLKEAINNNPKTWLITVNHLPMFLGKNAVETKTRNAWGELLYKGGCDLMFGGDNHNYVRTKPMAINKQDVTPPVDEENGTVQIVTGTGGAPLYGVGTHIKNSKNHVASIAAFGYTELEVDGDTLTLRQILANGTVFDSATYKANPKNQVDGALFDSIAARMTSDQDVVPLDNGERETDVVVEDESGFVLEEDEDVQ